MVEKIRQIKDEMLMQVEKDMHEGGASRVDPKMIDNIKDLAEAEKLCMESEKLDMEADYFESVSDAMQDNPMGYDGGMMYDDGMGYSRGGRGNMGYDRQGGRGYRRGYGQGRGDRRGYRGQSRDSMGRYASRRGYRRGGMYGHQDMMEEIRQMMEAADPQEREQLKMQLRQMTEQM